jgi:hypothetical protein
MTRLVKQPASEAATALAIAERLKRRSVNLLDPDDSLTFTRLSTVVESTIPGAYTSSLTGTASTTEIVATIASLVAQVNAMRGIENRFLYLFQANGLAT